MIKEICVLVFLGLNTWTDIRKREISLTAAGIFGAVGMLFLLWERGISWQLCLPLAAGGLFWGIHRLTGGAVGMGDSLLLAALGTVLEWQELCSVLLLGLGGCGICALVLLVVFHKGRNAELPFAPFLLLGYAGGLLL